MEFKDLCYGLFISNIISYVSFFCVLLWMEMCCLIWNCFLGFGDGFKKVVISLMCIFYFVFLN